MMQKLWIFGDSYADRTLNYMRLNPISVKSPTYFEGWSYWLEKDYEVSNFSQSGIGADSCFLDLTTKVDKEIHDLKDISVVFVLPEALGRVHMQGYDRNKSWTFYYHAHDKKTYNQILLGSNLNEKQLKQYDTYDKYHEFAKVFLTDYMETEEYQNKINMLLGAIDCYAKQFKRFILIPTNDISNYVNEKKENFFSNMIVKKDIVLYEFANRGVLPENEFLKLLLTRNSNINRQDPKMIYPNHLDNTHNKIIYELITEFMEI